MSGSGIWITPAKAAMMAMSPVRTVHRLINCGHVPASRSGRIQTSDMGLVEGLCRLYDALGAGWTEWRWWDRVDSMLAAEELDILTRHGRLWQFRFCGRRVVYLPDVLVWEQAIRDGGVPGPLVPLRMSMGPREAAQWLADAGKEPVGVLRGVELWTLDPPDGEAAKEPGMCLFARCRRPATYVEDGREFAFCDLHKHAWLKVKNKHL